MSHQRILLLQGKMGTFFYRFAQFLTHENKHVFKINFNYGDELFFRYKDKAFAFREHPTQFSTFLTQFIHKYHIQAVVCFNDCRPHHSIAKDVCNTLGVSFFVFEEGYLRPDYITLQEHGINGYSQLDIPQIDHLKFANDKPLYTNNRFWRLCLASIIYYAAVFVNKRAYPHYRHYRGLTTAEEMAAWLIAPVRKVLHYLPDKRLERRLTRDNDAYFVVALQVHNDSQISHHSDYGDVRDFITAVLLSFAKNAPPHTKLVFKHHPLDRGHRNYARYIKTLSKKQGVATRVFYGCDMHLPTLIRHSLGFVTINSTTALQAIYHKKPTKLTGRALYDLPRLADQQPLDTFWQQPTAPDHAFYLKFREYLIEQTQLNGSFYGKSPWKIAYQAYKNAKPTNMSS